MKTSKKITWFLQSVPRNFPQELIVRVLRLRKTINDKKMQYETTSYHLQKQFYRSIH